MESEADDLQFDKAEYESQSGEALPQHCCACDKSIQSEYYALKGRVVCALCRVSIAEGFSRGTPFSRFMRAFLAGLGAAVLGAAIYFGVSALTGYEFGLIAIVVGFLVGKAVQWGSRYRGGLGYQLLAMFLTYSAIVITYIPQLIEAITAEQSITGTAVVPEGSTAEPAAVASEAATAQALDSAQSEELSSAPEMEGVERPLGPMAHVIGWTLLFAFALALPFLSGLQNIMGLFIIGIALYEAWKFNQLASLDFEGPFSVASGGGMRPQPAS